MKPVPILPVWSQRLFSELEIADVRAERLAMGLTREQGNRKPRPGAWGVEHWPVSGTLADWERIGEVANESKKCVSVAANCVRFTGSRDGISEPLRRR